MLDVVVVHHVKNDDGNAIVHAEGESGGVHDSEALGEGFRVGDFVVFDGGGVLGGVGGIDAVHLGGLEDHLCADLAGTQRGGGVGGKEGVAGAGDEDDDAAQFQVPNSTQPNERFGDVFHLDGRLDAGGDTLGFQGTLEGHAVDDGGKHAHVIGGGAFHSFVACGKTAPDIAAANDDGDFHAKIVNFTDLTGHVANNPGGDGIAAAWFF